MLYIHTNQAFFCFVFTDFQKKYLRCGPISWAIHFNCDMIENKYLLLAHYTKRNDKLMFSSISFNR